MGRAAAAAAAAFARGPRRALVGIIQHRRLGKEAVQSALSRHSDSQRNPTAWSGRPPKNAASTSRDSCWRETGGSGGAPPKDPGPAANRQALWRRGRGGPVRQSARSVGPAPGARLRGREGLARRSVRSVGTRRFWTGGKGRVAVAGRELRGRRKCCNASGPEAARAGEGGMRGRRRLAT